MALGGLGVEELLRDHLDRHGSQADVELRREGLV